MLKKIYFLSILVILTACSSEDNLLQYSSEQQNVTLSASLEQQEASATRTSLTSTNSVVWSTNDEISVLSYYNDKANNDRFTLESGASKAAATFKGVLSPATRYYALYPYSSTAAYDGTNISFSLPQTQTYVTGSFGQGANPAVAVLNNSLSNMVFKNVCGVLSIYLSGTGNLESITLTSKKSGEYLWGDYILAADANIGTASQTLTHSANGSNSITLNCGSGVLLSATAKEFDIVVPPGTLSEGFDAVCTFTGGETFTISSTNDQTIVRSQKRIMETKVLAATVCANLEKDLVKQYLDYMDANPYPDGDYTMTYVTTYSNQKTDSYNRPAPVSISWDRNSGSTAQYLYVSENADFSDAYYNKEAISNSVSTYDIYNLIPGKKYYYKVTAAVGGEEVTLTNSAFNTAGRRRMLYIDGVYNARDLGGLPVTITGRTRIKYGKLFRCAASNNVTDTGRRQAQLAGIRAEMDLRGDSESGNLTASPFSMEGDTVDYKRISSASYAQLATSTTLIDEVQWIINEEKAGKPVIEHCAAGADRAGTLAFLMEGLLGVDENHQSIDYELTSFYIQRTRSGNQSGMYTGICKTSGEPISGVTYPATVTTTWQRRFYNYFYTGLSGHKISQADLDWFIDNMTE